ncbi:MAG: hypothetical protein GF393_00740 [Armatimonadia bacterium]|nr:hypothetical protein [Armatimonadia bacterium]
MAAENRRDLRGSRPVLLILTLILGIGGVALITLSARSSPRDPVEVLDVQTAPDFVTWLEANTKANRHSLTEERHGPLLSWPQKHTCVVVDASIAMSAMRYAERPSYRVISASEFSLAQGTEPSAPGLTLVMFMHDGYACPIDSIKVSDRPPLFAPWRRNKRSRVHTAFAVPDHAADDMLTVQFRGEEVGSIAVNIGTDG